MDGLYIDLSQFDTLDHICLDACRLTTVPSFALAAFLVDSQIGAGLEVKGIVVPSAIDLAGGGIHLAIGLDRDSEYVIAHVDRIGKRLVKRDIGLLAGGIEQFDVNVLLTIAGDIIGEEQGTVLPGQPDQLAVATVNLSDDYLAIGAIGLGRGGINLHCGREATTLG